MTKKIISSIKFIVVFSVSILAVISCEKDFEDVGVGLVNNNLFSTKDSVFDVISYSKNVDSSRVDNIPLYNLGVYNDPIFGRIHASFVSQIGYSTDLDFGLNPVIDTVIIDIPYFSTRDENNEDGSPNFNLDSILGNQENDFTLKVSRLATFLNALNPLDPTESKKYYSDENYSALSELYSEQFLPNKNDTVLYVKRRFLDDDFETIDEIDTIKKENLEPSIKIALNKEEMERIFFTEPTEADISSSENFINYFRGFLIEAEGLDGTLMSLQMSDASLNIYYTNEVLTDEEGTDLNNDGDTDDLQVPVKTKRAALFPMLGIRAGTYTRDYTGAEIESYLTNPNTVMGSDKLFVQGSAGSIAEIIFDNFDLDELRSNEWLINGAYLDVYVDDDENNRNVPEQLFLYNADDNTIIPDVITEGQVAGIGGILERDEDSNIPIRYRFFITDYMSKLLEPSSTRPNSKLAIKTYHTVDAPLSISDTIVKDFSWIPKGVVLRGNTDPLNDGKRLELKIFYTEINE